MRQLRLSREPYRGTSEQEDEDEDEEERDKDTEEEEEEEEEEDRFHDRPSCARPKPNPDLLGHNFRPIRGVPGAPGRTETATTTSAGPTLRLYVNVEGCLWTLGPGP